MLPLELAKKEKDLLVLVGCKDLFHKAQFLKLISVKFIANRTAVKYVMSLPTKRLSVNTLNPVYFHI